MLPHERKPHLRLLQEEALARRLRKTHPMYSKILSSIEMRKAGYRGEQNVDYHLTFLPENRYTILRDLRLIDQFPFQIDTLLLSPHLIIIIETKNYSGTLYFDKNSNQLTRILNEVEEGFANPLQQVQRQAYQLTHWLHKHKIHPIPIEFLVTISQPKTILKTNDVSYFNWITHAEHVVNKINAFDNRYRSPMVDEKTIRKISKLLIKENSPSDDSILTIWNISSKELKPGVECPACHTIPMKRLFSTWYCPFCKTESKDSHIQAIKDYFLLSPKITNKQCRDFLLISSRRISEHLLGSMNLTKFGSTKGIYYMESADSKKLQ